MEKRKINMKSQAGIKMKKRKKINNMEKEKKKKML